MDGPCALSAAMLAAAVRSTAGPAVLEARPALILTDSQMITVACMMLSGRQVQACSSPCGFQEIQAVSETMQIPQAAADPAPVQAGIGEALLQLVVRIGTVDCSQADELSPAGVLSLLQVWHCGCLILEVCVQPTQTGCCRLFVLLNSPPSMWSGWIRDGAKTHAGRCSHVFHMQAVKCLVAPRMLGPQLLLQRGVVPGLLSLIRPQHLASLADWEAQLGSAGQLPTGRTVPGLVATILQDGVLQPQSTALRDLYQARHAYPAPPV